MRGDDDAQGGHHDRARAAARPATGTASDAAPGDISSDVRAYRRRRTSASSRRSRPGSITVCRVIRVSERSTCSTTSCGADGEQHLADAGGVQRQPAADLADHRHRLAAGDPLDVERAEPVADGEVHGVADRGVHVHEERRRDLAQLELHRRQQAEVPELAADLVAAVRRAGRARPSRSARRAAGARWSAACPSARRSPTATAAGCVASNASRMASAREVTERPGVRAAAGHDRLLSSSGSSGLGSVAGRPYRPGMTGTTSAERAAPAAVPARAGRAAHPRRLPRLQEHRAARPAAHAGRPAAPAHRGHRPGARRGPGHGPQDADLTLRNGGEAVGPADPRLRAGARQRRPPGARRAGGGLAGQRGRPLPARRRHVARRRWTRTSTGWAAWSPTAWAATSS